MNKAEELDELADLFAETALSEKASECVAIMEQMAEALRAAEVTLEDLGACSDPDCSEPNCVHALPKVSAALRVFEGGENA